MKLIVIKCESTVLSFMKICNFLLILSSVFLKSYKEPNPETMPECFIGAYWKICKIHVNRIFSDSEQNISWVTVWTVLSNILKIIFLWYLL